MLKIKTRLKIKSKKPISRDLKTNNTNYIPKETDSYLLDIARTSLTYQSLFKSHHTSIHVKRKSMGYLRKVYSRWLISTTY